MSTRMVHPPSHRTGQSLLEVVMAAGVIIAAVVGSTTVILSTISVGRVSQSRVEAANFAREGIEIVRGIRDSNWLKRDQNVADGSAVVTSWDDTGVTGDGFQRLGQGAPFRTFYVQRGATGDWQLIDTGTNPVLIYFDPANNLFTQENCAGCQSTRYRRLLTIRNSNEGLGGGLGSIAYLNVLSEVCWRDRTGSSANYASLGCNRLVTAQELLYDWR